MLAASSVFIVSFSVALIYLVGIWKAFEKAGEPGWAAIVPFYNWWVMLRIARKPPIWFLFIFLPIVNIFFILATLIGIARNFGERAGFGLGLFFLGFIFWPMLGYGDYAYLRGEEEEYYEEHFEDMDPDDREDPAREEWDPLSDRQKF